MVQHIISKAANKHFKSYYRMLWREINLNISLQYEFDS